MASHLKPDLILGTVQLGLPYGVNNKLGMPSESEALDILKTAYESGIRYLDTAEAYGKSQELVSKSIKSGHDFNVYTKIKPDQINIVYYLESLRDKLGVQQLAGVSLHSEWSKYSSHQIRELISAKEKGLFRLLGTSVYTVEEGLEASQIQEIDLVQMPFNLLDGWPLRARALMALKDQGKTVHVRSIFLQGLFFHSGSHPALTQLEPALNHLQELAKDWPHGMIQMAIDYVKYNSYIDGVLMGAESQEQVLMNSRLWKDASGFAPLPQLGKLTPDAIKALDPRNW